MLLTPAHCLVYVWNVIVLWVVRCICLGLFQVCMHLSLCVHFVFSLCVQVCHCLALQFKCESECVFYCLPKRNTWYTAFLAVHEIIKHSSFGDCNSLIFSRLESCRNGVSAHLQLSLCVQVTTCCTLFVCWSVVWIWLWGGLSKVRWLWVLWSDLCPAFHLCQFLYCLICVRFRDWYQSDR